MARPHGRSPTVSISFLSVPSLFHKFNLLKKVSMNTAPKVAVEPVLFRTANLNEAIAWKESL